MQDISHTPDSTDLATFACSECGIALDYDAAIAALSLPEGVVLQIGSSFIPAPAHDSSTMVKCSHPAAGPTLKSALKLEEGVELGAVPAGEKSVRPPKSTNFEKMARRGQLNAFWAMREATKPEGK